MRTIRGFLDKHPHYKRALGLTSWAAVSLLLVAITFAIRLPNRVWLPDPVKYSDDTAALYNLPVRREIVFTRYGRTIRYHSDSQWITKTGRSAPPFTTIYAFQASPWLRASACPNIVGIKSLSPSDCVQDGELHGARVYTMHRRMASTMTESFVQVGNTFLYIVRSDRGAPGYFDAFKELSAYNTHNYLRANHERTDQINLVRKADEKALDQKNAEAYKLLDFTPVLPQIIPAGWQLNAKPEKATIEVDGPDIDHPSLISLSYRADEKQFITFRSGRLSDYKLDATCGPTPGSSMEHLPCRKVGSHYEYTEENKELTMFVRRLYYPVGDSLAMSQLVVYGHGVQPAYPTEMAQAQDTLTLSAKPVSKDALKGSIFHQIFFY